jgi:sorbitol-specific phosphotransferase system component IIC
MFCVLPDNLGEKRYPKHYTAESSFGFLPRGFFSFVSTTDTPAFVVFFNAAGFFATSSRSIIAAAASFFLQALLLSIMKSDGDCKQVLLVTESVT